MASWRNGYVVCDVQEQRKAAISRSVDIEELEKGVKHSISTVGVCP